MLHMYAVVLAVVLLVGALAAIIICVCVDIVPIIKSRGSTLVSRDSVTQEQTRMLKKSLQLKKLSASVDLIDAVHGRKTLAQALKSERPRFGSTPLSLLTGSGEKDSDLQIKTTVIMEALPKKSPLAESNNNKDSNKTEQDISSGTDAPNEDTPKDQGEDRYNSRQENVYVDNKISKIIARRTKSEGSPSINPGRAKSDIQEEGSANHAVKGAMTFNPRVSMETESQPRSHPNTPDVRTSRPTSSQRDDVLSSSREHIPDPIQHVGDRAPSHIQPVVRSKLYPRYGSSLPDNREFPQDVRGAISDGNGVPIEHTAEFPAQNCDSAYCKWCQMERDRNIKDRARERQLPFRRTESFPENYHANSSPNMNRNFPRQHSFDEHDPGIAARGIPFDRNKYCKTPHRGYSPCPDCFHQQTCYYTYQGDRNSPIFMVPNPGMGNIPKSAGPPAQMAALHSSSSSSSSSGSSSRFRHLRQPLEDIQEDTSDCYAIRDTEVTSTIDSRELSSPDDDTMPKSTENSSTSVSPLVMSENQSAMVSVSGS